METVFSVLCSMHAILRPLLFCLIVQACIESQDPVIQSLGFQSLGHLCEADVIGNPDCVVQSHSSALSLLLKCAHC